MIRNKRIIFLGLIFFVIQTKVFATDEFFIKVPNQAGDNIEIHSIVISNPDDFKRIREIMETIPLNAPLIVIDDGGTQNSGISPKDVADYFNKPVKVILEPTEKLSSISNEISQFYFREAAEKDLAQIRTVLAVVRAVVAGSVTSVVLITMQLPVAAIIAGSVVAAYVSGKMQLLNDYYKEWFTRRAFFDPSDHTNDNRIGWRLIYGSWKLGKESLVVLGYLTGMQWVLASFGGPRDFFENSLLWLGTAGSTAILSSFSEGIWTIFDADLRKELLTKNDTENRLNPQKGISRARTILLRSQYLAIVISAVSTMAEVFCAGSSINSAPVFLGFSGQELSNQILIGFGVSGFSFYFYRCTNLPLLVKKFMSNIKNCLFSFVKLS